jgi:Putative zinc-finger
VTDRRDVHPRELLSAYLDGELAETDRAAVEAHVADCAPCGALLDDFRAMAAIATREEPPPVPADLQSRIRAKVGLARVARARPLRFRLPYYRLGLAAAAGIVLTIGLWATRRESAPPGTPIVDRATAPDTLGGHESIEKEPRDQPGAPAPAGTDESLKALGYIGNEPQAKKDAAPSVAGRNSMEQPASPTRAPEPVIVGDVREGERPSKRQREPAGGTAAPAAGFAPAGPGGAEAGGSRQDAQLDHKAAASAQAAPLLAPRSAISGHPGEVLMLESTGYRVSAHQDGTVVLSTEGYSCSVRRDGTSVDPDIAALFALADSAGESAGPPPAARRGGTVVRLLKPRSAEEESAGGAPGPVLEGEQAVAIETRLRALLRDRYLALMESRCGAVPRVVRSP